MERDGQDVGERAAPLHRNRRRGFGEAGECAVGGALEGLRFGAEWSGTGIGEHPNSPAGYSGAAVQGAGIDGRAIAAAVWIFPGCADVWHASAWGDRAGAGPRDDAAGGGEVHSRSDCVCEDHCGGGFDGGIAKRSGSGAARPIKDSSYSRVLGGKVRMRRHVEVLAWGNYGWSYNLYVPENA